MSIPPPLTRGGNKFEELLLYSTLRAHFRGLRFLLPSLATGFLSQANLLSREPKRASCSRLRATGWSLRATTRLKNPPMPSAAAANEISTFATIVDSPTMVYARRGALHLPSNLSPRQYHPPVHRHRHQPSPQRRPAGRRPQALRLHLERRLEETPARVRRGPPENSAHGFRSAG